MKCEKFSKLTHMPNKDNGFSIYSRWKVQFLNTVRWTFQMNIFLALDKLEVLESLAFSMKKIQCEVMS
jgi:hypothetical protein